MAPVNVTPPQCPTCGSSNTALRTVVQYGIYYICNDCSQFWGVTKPEFLDAATGPLPPIEGRKPPRAK